MKCNKVFLGTQWDPIGFYIIQSNDCCIIKLKKIYIFSHYLTNLTIFENNLSSTKYDFIFSHLLTPWSRDPLEKLTGSAASREIPRIFGTRRFLTVPTSARHLSLS